MFQTPLVPATFTPPEEATVGGLVLKTLTVDDVYPDYEAVMESAIRLQGLFRPGDPWPKGLTLEEDMIDLAWHQKEFALRFSFAYGVWSEDQTRYVGCLYVTPDPDRQHDARLYLWLRRNRNEPPSEADFAAAAEAWLRDVWPFESFEVRYPSKDGE